MDISPEMWVVIIMAGTAVGGLILWFTTGTRKKR